MLRKPQHNSSSRRKRTPPDLLRGRFRPLKDARLRRGSEPGRLRAIMRRRARKIIADADYTITIGDDSMVALPSAGGELNLVPSWGGAAIIGKVGEEDAPKYYLLPKSPGLTIDIGAVTNGKTAAAKMEATTCEQGGLGCMHKSTRFP